MPELAIETLIARLKRKREAQKRALANQEAYFASKDFDVISELEYEEVLLRNSKLEELFTQFDTVQSELDEIAEDVNDERGDFEKRVYSLWPKIKLILRNNAPRNNDSMHEDRVASQQMPNVKLPEISLPTFSGDFISWLNFRDTFKAIVIDNAGLSNVARFYYLSSALSGEAKTLISNVHPSEENFEVAWRLLTNRYNNTRLIATNHIAKLLSPPSVQRGSAASLRSLIDHFTSHVQALGALDLDDSSIQDLILSHYIINLLDSTTIKEWETHTQPDKIPTLQELLDFLERRCKILEMVNNTTPQAAASDSRQKQFVRAQPAPSPYNQSCPKCRANHFLFACPSFAALPVPDRKNFVSSRGLCVNCLRPLGNRHVCSKINCRMCGKPHHSLLHFDNSSSRRPQVAGSNPDVRPDTRGQVTTLKSGPPRHIHSAEPSHSIVPGPTVTSCASSNQVFHGAKSDRQQQGSNVLLATATVKLIDPRGRPVYCTALLDSGSDCSLVTKRTADLLQLRMQPSITQIHSVSQLQSVSMGSVDVFVRSRTTDWSSSVNCLVVDQIIPELPMAYIDTSGWNIPAHIELADPEFFRPKHIDILLGANIFFEILRPRKFTPLGNLPFIQETSLGWILSGRTPTIDRPSNSRISATTLSRTDVQTQLQKFWEIEEVDTPLPTSNEEYCERHFTDNTTRDDDGRYIVRLPFSPDAKPLGNSLASATRRFHSLERRLQRDSDLRSQYLDFMLEYLNLDHMELAPDCYTANCYFIPHHPVFKPSSTTTKLRVVFDASALSSNGLSLNSMLLVGPVVQQDLFSIVLRFRTHIYSYAADITMMYRQVLVHPADRDYQRILWRFSPSDEIKQYRLNTVTYGTSSASYLATRALNQLVFDDGDPYPLASKAILNDFYVDDLISGTDDPDEAISTYHELNTLLSLGGFNLRKWSTNYDRLSDIIPADLCESSELRLLGDSQGETVVKTLGLYWQSNLDVFHLQTPSADTLTSRKLSKRTLLSQIASIFDPLGLISPIVVACKVLIQSLWAIKLDWDDPIPADIATRWFELSHQLPMISDIAIPRLVKCTTPIVQLHLHGFADASETAYGACLYLHSLDSFGNSTTRLICAKSRVAPLKTISIPRLELCAALLLANLLAKAIKALSLNLDSMNLWSDSTIVLAWLTAPPSKWTTFVANRVSQIQTLTKDCTWRHVSSQDNPADLISRGASPADLKASSLWWSGPSWIPDPSVRSAPPCPTVTCVGVPEIRRCNLAVTTNYLDTTILRRFSSHLRTIRVLAYCLRFISNCKAAVKTSGPLTSCELTESFITCVRIIQTQCYSTELKALTKHEPLPTKSVLASLHPFVDAVGILRVGGRLTNSDLPFPSKHQMILPKNHPFTRNFIIHTHCRLLHAGPQLLTASVRQSVWVPAIRTLVRSVIHSCLTCFKLNAQASEQLMGNLPAARVKQTFPFINVGVDYCGPFLIKFGGPRSKISTKSYVALFICMATKAIHLEIVTSMSTQAFLAAFTRFCSRRGTPSHIFSDNGSNFIGANHELEELANLLASQTHQQTVQDATSHLNVQWSFIPPRAPHFGGLWEAGVKSFKYHLRRVTNSQLFTYEEFSTLACQVEAVLNSRPISPLSGDATDSEFLSPGHFLVGRPITALPSPNLLDLPTNRLSRWQLLQSLLQSLWKRWSLDYLQTLQQRTKWLSVTTNLSVGTLVLLKEDGAPPLQWSTAIIEQVHPGTDGLVRTVTLRTPAGTFKRPITKVCPLPFDPPDSAADQSHQL